MVIRGLNGEICIERKIAKGNKRTVLGIGLTDISTKFGRSKLKNKTLAIDVSRFRGIPNPNVVSRIFQLYTLNKKLVEVGQMGLKNESHLLKLLVTSESP